MDDVSNRWQRLKLTALVAAATHLAAGLAMAIVLRQGIGPNIETIDRMRFVVDHQLLWTASWLLWNAAALSFLFFSITFALAHRSNRPDSNVALIFAVLLPTAGIVADLAGEAIEMGLLPGIAARAIANISAGESAAFEMALFGSFHHLTVMLTAYVANGLYSLGAGILTWSARASYPKWILVAGMSVCAAGLFLSLVALINWGAGLIVANALLVPLIVIWQAGVAVIASGKARQSSHQ